ncbi:MAG: nitroreductase family protein [Pirellulaceae bacterium]
MSPEEDLETAIRERVTTKVLADKPFPGGGPSTDLGSHLRSHLRSLLELAGMAPFHRACEDAYRSGTMPGIEPWRFHCLDSAGCRELRKKLPAEEAGNIPLMLNSADTLIMATWLPNVASAEFELDEKRLFEPTLGNMEHIAAASAAIQNLLLAATSRGISSYWSSGGVLRTGPIYQNMGIATDEILLGAIFLFPTETHDARVVGSKLRDKRTNAECWSRQVELR